MKKFSEKMSEEKCPPKNCLISKRQLLEAVLVQTSSADAQLSALTPIITDTNVQLNRFLECAEEIPIRNSNIPITLSVAATYCVVENLTHAGANPAITVTSPAVKIKGNNFLLTLTNPAGIGITAFNVTDLEVQDLNFEDAPGVVPSTLNNNALRILTVRKARLRNLRISRLARGIFINNSKDVKINDSLFEDITGGISPAGAELGSGNCIRIDSGNDDIFIENCVFRGPGPSLVRSNVAIFSTNFPINRNLQIRGCTFSNIDGVLAALNADGIVMEKCSAVMSTAFPINFVQLGSIPLAAGTRTASNVIIRDSVFKGISSGPGFDGIFVLSGNNCLLQSLTIESNTSATPVPPIFLSGAIHIGLPPAPPIFPEQFFNSVKILDVLINGANLNGVLIERGSGIILDNVNISGAETGVNIPFVGSNTIKNSALQGNGTGIRLGASSRNNTVFANDVRAGGTGISDAGLFNLLKENNVYGNSGSGIISNASTQLSNNITFNNGIGPVAEEVSAKLSDQNGSYRRFIFED